MTKIGQGENTLFGPKKALVCGFAPETFQLLKNFLNKFDLTVIGVGIKHKEEPIKKLLEKEEVNLEDTEKMPPTIVLGGIKEKELHLLLKELPQLKLGNILMAVFTPYSLEWKLAELLKHLLLERSKVAKQAK